MIKLIGFPKSKSVFLLTLLIVNQLCYRIAACPGANCVSLSLVLANDTLGTDIPEVVERIVQEELGENIATPQNIDAQQNSSDLKSVHVTVTFTGAAVVCEGICALSVAVKQRILQEFSGTSTMTEPSGAGDCNEYFTEECDGHPLYTPKADGGYMWLVGAGLSIIGSVCSNLGVNIQKYSFIVEEKKEEHKRKAYYANPMWLFGLFMVIFGSLGDFFALGLAAQSIVAPIGATTLVANIFFAHFGLGEDLSKKDLFGTFLIIGGSVLAVMFGSHEEESYTADQLWGFYAEPIFMMYGGLVVFSICFLYFMARFIEKKQNDLLEIYDDFDRASAVDTEDADETMNNWHKKIEATENAYKKFAKFHPFTYCALSGIWGGQNILFGKMVAEMIAKTLEGDSQFTDWRTYFFICCMLCSIFTQLHFLALALKKFDALYVVPVFQCFFIIVSTLAGAAYFNEFGSFTLMQGIFFPVGFGSTLYGVKILSSRDMSDQPRATDMEELNDSNGRPNSETIFADPQGSGADDSKEEKEKCSKCTRAIAEFQCQDCDQRSFCKNCDKSEHQGIKIKMHKRIPIVCQSCSGTGSLNYGVCPVCIGTGKYHKPHDRSQSLSPNTLAARRVQLTRTPSTTKYALARELRKDSLIRQTTKERHGSFILASSFGFPHGRPAKEEVQWVS